MGQGEHGCAHVWAIRPQPGHSSTLGWSVPPRASHTHVPSPAPCALRRPPALPSATAEAMGGTCMEFFPSATISNRVSSVVTETFLFRSFRGGRPWGQLPCPLPTWTEGAPCA